MSPQDRLKLLRSEAKKYEDEYIDWGDDIGYLVHYKQGLSDGYEQALEDARNKAVVTQMNIYAKIQLVEMLIDRGETESEIKNMLNTINTASEELIQILTIPEEK